MTVERFIARAPALTGSLSPQRINKHAAAPVAIEHDIFRIPHIVEH